MSIILWIGRFAAQGIIAYCAPRILIALGVPLDLWIVRASRFVLSSPLGSAEALWLAFAVFFVVLAAVEARWKPVEKLFNRIRSAKNEQRNDTNVEGILVPNWPIRELFECIDPNVLDNDRWLEVGLTVKDWLSTGQLSIWGRRIPRDQWKYGPANTPSALVKIPPTYWAEADFSYRFFSSKSKMEPHTFPEDDMEGYEYSDLQVNREEVEKLMKATDHRHG